MTVVEADFDRLIGRDRQLVRVYLAVVGCIVGIGVVVGVMSVVEWSDSERVELMVGLGGPCIAALGSALPARQAWVRLDRIIGLRTLKAKWLELRDSKSASKRDLDRIEAILWQLYGEGLTGAPGA